MLRISNDGKSGAATAAARLLALAGMLLSVAVVAESTNFQADLHEADWEVQASVFECSLRQPIPDYGEVAFYHRAGEALELRLEAYNPLLSDSTVLLRAQPAPWNYQQRPRELARLEPAGDTTVISLDETLSRKLMAEMLDGMVPIFQGPARYDPDHLLSVSVSPLHFQRAYRDYQTCSAALLPVNFDQIGRSTIFWRSGQRELDDAARKLLDDAVRYAQADDRVTGFEVDSFTDTVGERRANLLLSEHRAFQVTNYLVSQGIDPETIATRAHGEREEYLIAKPERSAADRDRNRRVNIVMLRR